MTGQVRDRRTTGGGTAPPLFDFLRLAALIAVDLVRPPRPENRLPKRWAPTAPRQ